MANFSNEIMIAGQLYPLGDESIQVVGFWNNVGWGFHNSSGTAPVPSGPTVPGLEVAPTVVPDRPARIPSRNRSMRDAPVPGNIDANLEMLRGQVRHAVIHHDATYTSASCFRVLNARNLSTHFMVNHDGNLIQGLDVWWKALHAREFNPTSVGIDMNNVASIEGHQVTRSDELFGTVADYATREIITGRAGGSREKSSFAYTEKQYTTLCALLKILHETIGLPLIYPQDPNGGGVLVTRLRDAMNFRGFFGHWHCQAGKWDPGPGFSWETVVECLHGKSNHWPIDCGVPRLRDLGSQQAVDDATNVFYTNTEEGSGGGTYPVGLNQQWHDGVHLFAEEGTPVKAVADGKILLTRNGPNFPVGSPNYVLIQHDMVAERVEIKADGESEVIEENLRWYSLYMHLQRMNHESVPDDASPDAPEPDPEEEAEEENEEPLDMPTEGEDGSRIIPSWYQRLVALARQYKGSPLQPRADYTMWDIQSDPEAFYNRARSLLRVQEFRHAYQCIEDGNPFKWVNDVEVDDGVPVRGGEVIGYVGDYGVLEGENVRKRSMVQLQIFSTSPVFDDTRFDSQTWTRVQADLSGNDLVSAGDIVYPIIGGEETAEEAGITRRDLGRGRVVTPSEIRNFFRSGSALTREKFRRMIAYHLSEWDEATDDSLTADSQVLWPWQTDKQFVNWRAHHVGFKWLTAETRTLLTMEGPQPIYTYHPIYLLGWWALNFGRSIGQAFEGLSVEELSEAIAQDDGEGDEEAGDDHTISIEDLDDFRIRYPQFEDIAQAEWTAEETPEDPFDRRD